LEHFYDNKKSFFVFTSNLDEAFTTAYYETKDNMIPASNSVMAKNVFQLSIYFSNSYYEKISHQMLLVTLRGIEYPSTYSNWMDLTLNYPKKQRISHLWRTGFSALYKNKQPVYSHCSIGRDKKRIYIAFFKFPLPKPGNTVLAVAKQNLFNANY
jgi:uncharacterized protein YyaL (SSP411 family)